MDSHTPPDDAVSHLALGSPVRHLVAAMPPTAGFDPLFAEAMVRHHAGLHPRPETDDARYGRILATVEGRWGPHEVLTARSDREGRPRASALVEGVCPSEAAAQALCAAVESMRGQATRLATALGASHVCLTFRAQGLPGRRLRDELALPLATLDSVRRLLLFAHQGGDDAQSGDHLGIKTEAEVIPHGQAFLRRLGQNSDLWIEGPGPRSALAVAGRRFAAVVRDGATAGLHGVEICWPFSPLSAHEQLEALRGLPPP